MRKFSRRTYTKCELSIPDSCSKSLDQEVQMELPGCAKGSYRTIEKMRGWSVLEVFFVASKVQVSPFDVEGLLLLFLFRLSRFHGVDVCERWPRMIRRGEVRTSLSEHWWLIQCRCTHTPSLANQHALQTQWNQGSSVTITRKIE